MHKCVSGALQCDTLWANLALVRFAGRNRENNSQICIVGQASLAFFAF
jgi:hypothetical protein